jgi:hypothetical protein
MQGYVLRIGYGPPSSPSNILLSAARPSYFDLNWSPVDTDSGPYDVVYATSYAIESDKKDTTKVEVSFTR